MVAAAMLVVVTARVLIVMPTGMGAVVATFMPAVPAIPVLATMNTAVTTIVPIMVLAGMRTMMALVVLGAGASRRANHEKEDGSKR